MGGRRFSPAVESFTAFTPGTQWPIGALDAGTRNVGCRVAPGSLIAINSDVTVTPGMVVEGKDIVGRVTGTGDETTVVRDCIIRGENHATSQSWSARGSGGNFGGTVFEWCTFDQAGRESPFTSSFEGGGYEARYCDIRRSVDGVMINSAFPITLHCNRISHGYYFAWWNDGTGAVRTTTFVDYGGTTRTAPFPNQSSGDVHSDVLQITRGQGHVIRGNNMGGPRNYTLAQTTQVDPTVAGDYAIMIGMDADSGYGNAAIMVNGYAVDPLGALIETNLLAGGAATVNLAPSGADTLAGITVRNNRFVRQPGGIPNVGAILRNSSAATVTGNVWDDDGTAVP